MKIKKSFREKALAKIISIVQTFDTSVGVEIRPEKIYAVRLRKYFKSFRILYQLEVLRDGQSNPQDQILDILGRGKIKDTYLSISYSEDKIFKRILSIPYISESEIGSYLIQNLPDILTVPEGKNSICIQYFILSKTPEFIQLIIFFSRNVSWTCSMKSEESLPAFFKFAVDEYYLLGYLLNQEKDFTGYWINYNGHYGSLYQFKSGKIIEYQHYSCKNGKCCEKFELDNPHLESATIAEGFFTGPSDFYNDLITRFPYFSYLSAKSPVSKRVFLKAYAASLSPFINAQFPSNYIFNKNEPQKIKNYVSRKLYQIGILDAACVTILYFLIVGLNMLLSSQNRQTIKNMNVINQKRAELNLIQAEYEHRKLLLEYYQSMGIRPSIIPYYIFRISELLPVSLHLINLEFSHSPHELQQIELDGFSKDESAIFNLIIRLDKERFVKKCYLEEMKRNDTSGRKQLKIRAQIKFKIFIHV